MQVIGTIGADAVQPEGQEFITFSVASNYKTKDGEQKTIWTDCTSRALKLLPHLKKGMVLHLEGFPKAQAWKDKEGNIQSKVALAVKEINFCGGGQKSEPSTPTASGLVPQVPTEQVAEEADTLPF